MDTEGMTPHPIFEAFKVVTDSVHDSLIRASRTPSGPSAANQIAGWDFAFADMDADNEREQAFAVSLGFTDASEYHAETEWCDRVGLMVDWYEREDLRP